MYSSKSKWSMDISQFKDPLSRYLFLIEADHFEFRSHSRYLHVFMYLYSLFHFIFLSKICFLIIKTMCNYLRNFTVPILSKIEIAIYFNGLILSLRELNFAYLTEGVVESAYADSVSNFCHSVTVQGTGS